MSSINVGNIKSITSAPPVISNVAGTEIGRVARAYANFNGYSASPVTPRTSFNIASITKTGGARYTLTFSTPMQSANYVITGTVSYNAYGNAVSNIQIDTSIPPTANSFSVFTQAANSANQQLEEEVYVMIVVHGV